MKINEKEQPAGIENDPVIKAFHAHFQPPPGHGSGYIIFDWRSLILFAPLIFYALEFYEKPAVHWLLLFYSCAMVILHLIFVSRLKQGMANILNPVSFVKIVMVNFVLIVIYFGMGFAFIQKIDPTQFKVESSDPLFINMIYYSFVTIATVGYGDIVPTSWVSKLFAVCEILVGIWFLVMMIPVAVADQVERIRHYRETKIDLMEELERGIKEGRLQRVPKPNQNEEKVTK